MPGERSRIFLISPANCSGERARILMRPHANFELAMRLKTPMGVPIGEVFAFLSGLYFRGKLAYGRRFGAPPSPKLSGAYVLTTNRGLLPIDTPITHSDLTEMATVPIDLDEPRYREPLERDVRAIAKTCRDKCDVVLLGSVATKKYVDVLLPILGQRLMFPAEFVGRGDMSRGGLLLRCVREERELTYVPIEGAVRHGVRPPKLQRL